MPLTPDEQAMVNANVGLVKHVLAKYRTPTEEWDDAYQDGLIGLMRAVQKFDPAKGFKFSTYAVWWIRQGIQRGRGLSRGLDYRSAVRRRVQHDPPLSLDRPIDDTEVDLTDVVAGSEDPAGEVSSDQVAAQLMHMSMRLCRDDLDRAVMLAVAQGHPLKALATEFGVSTNTPIVRWRRIKSRMCHPTMRNQTRETA